MNLIYPVLGIAISIYIVYSVLKALNLLKKGGIEITEAAQELNNEKLHSAGTKINKGADILYDLYLITIILSVAVTVAVFAVNFS